MASSTLLFHSSAGKIQLSRCGFTLVELSIVLVILGLLVGGVLTGQSLIRASELRSISADYARYATAVNAFRDKYFALPGDMTNATSFWGIAAGSTGTDATCYNAASTTTATCNGNGNGRLFWSDNIGDGSAPEWYRSWQHLANAGLIEGRYTGRYNNAGREATPGINVPRSRYPSAGFTLMSNDAGSADSGWWSGSYDGFGFGAIRAGAESNGELLKPEDAWNLDTKQDDGNPVNGRIRSYKGQPFCNSSTAITATYNLADTGKSCGLFFAINSPGTLP